jgi:hypothetical protein
LESLLHSDFEIDHTTLQVEHVTSQAPIPADQL